MMDFGHFWRFPASPVSENFGAMHTQRHRSFLAPGRPETLKNVQKPSVSIDFGVQKFLKEIWVPKGSPIWDFWGSGPRVGKGFGRGIERMSKHAYLIPQTSLKRLLPGPLLIPYLGPNLNLNFSGRFVSITHYI